MAKRPNTPPTPASTPVRREYDGIKIRYVPPEERARIESDPGFDLFKLIIAIMIVLFVVYAICKS